MLYIILLYICVVCYVCITKKCDSKKYFQKQKLSTVVPKQHTEPCISHKEYNSKTSEINFHNLNVIINTQNFSF